jgi:hypothetical protein
VCAAPIWLSAEDPLLEEIRFEKISNGEERVFLQFNGEYFPEIFAMEGEKYRIVCDFIDVGIAKGVKRTTYTSGELIKQIRVGTHRIPERKIRIVLDLDSGRRYDIGQHFFRKEKIYAVIIKAEEFH